MAGPHFRLTVVPLILESIQDCKVKHGYWGYCGEGTWDATASTSAVGGKRNMEEAPEMGF